MAVVTELTYMWQFS